MRLKPIQRDPPFRVPRPRPAEAASFPRTRYQGSKRKLVGKIVDELRGLEFTTALDAFGGTGALSYALKRNGKRVTYNDVLAFNQQIGLALIQNDTVTLTDDEVENIGVPQVETDHHRFIEATFSGVYFTDEENRWLDTAVTNIHGIGCCYKRAMAWFALFQSCMAKRPYNLFHRRNLYMRTANVERGFGNKASWDRSFPDHFRRFVTEANRAVIDGGGACCAVCSDALDLEPDFDLIYIDTPYINRSGVGVDYRDFYHFLEGLVHYDAWPNMIDLKSKHRRLRRRRDPWSHGATCHDMFRRLFSHFRESSLVVSYRSDGIPSIEELVQMLREVKSSVRVVEGDRYQYALSNQRNSREVLLIGTD